MAVHQSLSTQLVSRDLWKIRLTGSAISVLRTFRSLGDWLSSPAALSDPHN